MIRRWSRRRTEVAVAILAAGTTLSLLALVGSSYRATREWRRSEERLAERRASEAADRLVAALVSDMRGAQAALLTSGWEDLALVPPADSSRLVGSALARYPYAESFFAWRQPGGAEAMTFFHRSDRPPPWTESSGAADPFPVSVAKGRSAARVILDRMGPDARQGRRTATFEATIGGLHYQVVARLLYRDPFHEVIDRMVGFTVNLAWVRQHYFPEIARQVAQMGENLPLAIVDDRGRPIGGTGLPHPPVIGRPFAVQFFDPLQVGIDPAGTRVASSWAVQVGVPDDEGLAAATRGASRTLLVAAVAVAALVIGLLLTARAARDHSRLASMRSDLVSTVTHELKTPIATIRAIGDTVASGRVTSPPALREYALLVVQESRRLGRLVDNLLAYSRMAEPTDLYAFSPLSPKDLVTEVLKEFRTRLATGGFEVTEALAPDVPLIRGDRTALKLALGNVVDNAIRYSDRVRRLVVRTGRAEPGRIAIEVSDAGMGIPAAEIPHVTRRFQRGRGSRGSGSGLGLAIVQRIVTDHGGSLGIESRVGEGTTVRIVVPASEGADDQARADR